MSCGVSRAVGNGRATARCDAVPQRRVRPADATPGRPSGSRPRPASARSPSAASRCAVHLVGALAGQRADVDLDVDAVGDHVRLHPAPAVTFGENVVCVHAWRCAAGPGSGSAASTVVDLRRVEQHGRELVVDVRASRRARARARGTAAPAGTRRGAARPPPPSRARCRFERHRAVARACRARAAGATRRPSRRR